MKVGDKVKGVACNVPRIASVSGRRVPENSNEFEGVVVEVESAETSDVGEEMVEVEYTQPHLWAKLHGETKDWYPSEEVELA